MMTKMKELWNGSGRWFIIGLPLAAAAIAIAVWHAGSVLPEPEKLLAEPATESEVTFDMEVNRAYTSEDGIVVIQPDSNAASSPAGTEEMAVVKTSSIYTEAPEHVWEQTGSLSAEDYTLPEEAVLEDGSMGVLTIPRISLSAQVYEAENGEMEAMTKGVAHFSSTSAWDGNIGLCSHNVAPNGAVAHFRALHLLEEGDSLTYKTALGEREYKVAQIKEISEDDWSYLGRSVDGENKITMITCITGKPTLRLMVQALEA